VCLVFVCRKDITKLDTRHDPQRIAIELHLHNNFVCYEYKSGVCNYSFPFYLLEIAVIESINLGYVAFRLV
jgi:hypothetical protein